MSVVVVSEPAKPASRTRLTAPPKRVKAVDPHRDGLEPFLDVVPGGIVEVTAQVVASEGSQIPTSIDEKLRVGDIVFLGEAMQKRRRGIGPAAAVDINLQQQLRVRVDRGVEPLVLAIYLDLLLIDCDPRRRCRRGVALGLGQLLFPIPDRLITAIDTNQAKTPSTSRTDNPIE